MIFILSARKDISDSIARSHGIPVSSYRHVSDRYAISGIYADYAIVHISAMRLPKYDELLAYTKVATKKVTYIDDFDDHVVTVSEAI